MAQALGMYGRHSTPHGDLLHAPTQHALNPLEFGRS